MVTSRGLARPNKPVNSNDGCHLQKKEEQKGKRGELRLLRGQQIHQVYEAGRVSPFVVVPGEDLD